MAVRVLHIHTGDDMRPKLFWGIAALFATPLDATSITLSSNLGLITQPGGVNGLPTPVTNTTWITSSFGTGNAQYYLSNVQLLLEQNPSTAFELALYSNSSGSPGQQLALIAWSPGNCGNPCLAEFNGNSFPLMPNSTYWLVLRGISAGPGPSWLWSTSTAGIGPGFQHTWGQSLNGGTTWSTVASDPMVMGVFADIPEPGTIFLFAAGLAWLLWRRSSAVL